MAEIQEYTPQIQTPEPQGGMSPNIELSGAAGRGLEDLGNAAFEGSQYIYKRQQQKDISSIYAYTADQRAQKFEELQKGIQDGSFKQDDFLNKFDDESNQGLQNLDIQTAGGKEFFQRQNARLRGQLIQKSSHGMSLIASNETKAKWTEGSSKIIGSIEDHPDTWHDGMGAGEEAIKVSGLDAVYQAKGLLDFKTEATKAMLRGYAKLGTTTDDQGNVTFDGPQNAREMMKSPEVQGYLKGEDQHKMEGEIKGYERDDDTEKARAQKAVEQAQKAQDKKWYKDNFAKISTGAMPPSQIRQGVENGEVSPTLGEHLQEIVRRNAKQDVETNQHVYADVRRRMLDPNSPHPIKSMTDPAILQAQAQGLIAQTGPQSMETLKKGYDNSPAGLAAKRREKALYNLSLTIKSKDLMNGGFTPSSVKNSNDFMDDLYQEQENYTAKGQDPSELLDPNSKNYWGFKVQVYKDKASTERAAEYQARIDKANGLHGPAPSPEAKRPGESAMDNLLRTPPPELRGSK